MFGEGPVLTPVQPGKRALAANWIAISGKQYSGKTILANMILAETPQFQEISFGDPVKTSFINTVLANVFEHQQYFNSQLEGKMPNERHAILRAHQDFYDQQLKGKPPTAQIAI